MNLCMHQPAQALREVRSLVRALNQLLAAVQETGAIAQGARTMGMSYRHAWGQIKNGEPVSATPSQPSSVPKKG